MDAVHRIARCVFTDPGAVQRIGQETAIYDVVAALVPGRGELSLQRNRLGKHDKIGAVRSFRLYNLCLYVKADDVAGVQGGSAQCIAAACHTANRPATADLLLSTEHEHTAQHTRIGHTAFFRNDECQPLRQLCVHLHKRHRKPFPVLDLLVQVHLVAFKHLRGRNGNPVVQVPERVFFIDMVLQEIDEHHCGKDSEKQHAAPPFPLS